ncbi:hypothetical protein OF83DRAFT_1097593 [Amylostereum chailletii]|nr:hypothetical protein OF83DRAFT_1097593 [Amylostereum chailletii]
MSSDPIHRTIMPMAFSVPSSSHLAGSFESSQKTHEEACVHDRHHHSESCHPVDNVRLPPGWELHIHPQGWLYFQHPELRIITDDDIRKPEEFETVARYLETFPLAELPTGDHFEVLLPRDPRPNEHILTLFINHALQLAAYNLGEVVSDSDARSEPRHLNRRRRMYWNYLQWHSNHQPCPEDAESEVKDALTWYQVDNLISGPRSVVPFSKEECRDLLQTLAGTQGHKTVGRTVFLSWLLREIWSFRSLESYGQYNLRDSTAIRKDRAPLGPPSHLSSPLWLSFILGFFFFSIPNTYLEHVRVASEYHGRLSNIQNKWEVYTQRLVNEYQDFLLIATVLLSATVGFLAVPDIDAFGRAAGIVSVFASLGSITIGVFCVWRHQANMTKPRTFAYLHNAHRGPMGLHGHAMFLSLPPVLLVWGIIAFGVGFIAFTVQDIDSPDKGDKVSAWVALSVSLSVIIFVAAGLYTFAVIWQWRRSRVDQVRNLQRKWVSRLSAVF